MTAKDEILRVANALLKPGEVVELRIFETKNGHNTIIAGYFDNFDKLAQATASYSGRPGIEGLYWTLNPCVRALLARAANRLTKLKATTSDKDIQKRTRFLIDCDPVRPSGISATDDEKERAADVTRQIRRHLRHEGWPQPFVADSGNGYHLLYPVDLPNDKPSHELIKACVTALAAMFDNDAVKIDTTVHNAARICKVYGSVAAKGESTSDRPHRTAHLLHVPKSPQIIVSRELLEALAAKAPKQSETPRTTQSNGAGRISPEKVEEFLAQAGIDHGGRIPYAGGWKWQLRICWFDASHTATSVIVTLGGNGALGYHCSHNSCKGNDWHKFRNEVENKLGYRFSFADSAYICSVEWANPLPLADDLPAVQPFAAEFLPKSFLPLVEDLSERMQTPMDYAAASVIVALAGCVNRRAVMQPKAEDTSWRVIPNLWGAIIAPPGMMKSPILRAATLPLTHIEDKWRAEFESARADFELEKERAELRWQAWREDYKNAVKKGGAEPIQPDKTLRQPAQQRLVLCDATFEKLHEILQENPAGVVVLRDELTGWLATLDKQGREGERAFFLQAWNGDGGFTVDRIGRGSIHVPAVCVSLFGAIQPARLRWYLSDTVAGGPNDDGLFQRFQIIVWPDCPRDWKLIDRAPNNHALAMTEKILSSLAHLSADFPVRMRFDCDSQKVFFEWLTELEGKVREERGLHPAIVAHLSKYRSLMPSLAALFELADRAAADDELGGTITVNLEHARKAAALCEYLESHAKRIYACIVSPEHRAARELARHIQAGDLKNPFKTRDVYLRGWSGLDDPDRVRSACRLLEDAGWISEEVAPRSQGGGRPSEAWQINPMVSHAK
jgi:hypothetical protein